MTRRPSPQPTPLSPTPGGKAQPAAPRNAPLPNERDEATGTTSGVPNDVVQQAHRDLERGLTDTDRGPVLDDAYRKQKRQG